MATDPPVVAPPEDATTVTDPRQVRLLTDESSKRYFKPFLARERTVTQAAEEIGCSVSTMLYRVRTFLAADLLRVARVEPRHGRPIKHYRSTADAYFVSFAATPFADLEERFRAQFQPIMEARARGLASVDRNSPGRGEYLFRPSGDPTNVWTMYGSADATAVPSTYRDVRLHLDDAAAKRVLARIHALFEEVRRQERPRHGRPYLFEIGLVPHEDDRE